MQHINRMLELYRIHGSVSISAVVGNDLQDARTFALPRLRFRMLAAKLRYAESGPDVVFHGLGKLHQVILCRSDPEQRIFAGNGLQSNHRHYPSSGMACLGLLLTVYSRREIAAPGRQDHGVEEYNLRRMKVLACRRLHFVGLLMALCYARGALGEEPQKVALCQLVADPGTYNHKLVEVEGFISSGFEDFTLFDPSCSSTMDIWLEYGHSLDVASELHGFDRTASLSDKWRLAHPHHQRF